MTRPAERVYRFETAAHWSAGARQNLTLDGDVLVVPEELAVQAIPGTGPIDGGSLPAFDAEGRLTWLRAEPCELVRRPGPLDRGLTVLGRLNVAGRPSRMVSGPSLIWVLTETHLERFSRASRQRLSPVELDDGWTVLDLVGAGDDGAWMVGVDDAGALSLRSVDCWGHPCHGPIALDDWPSDRVSAASTEDGRFVVVIDPVGSTGALVIDVGQREVVRFDLDEVHHGSPTLVAMSGDRIHLLSADGDLDDRAVLETLSLDGAVEDRQRLGLPPSLGRPQALVADSDRTGGTTLAMVAACGLAEIVAEASATEPRLSTFITPSMASPETSAAEWNRAEVDVVLPAGTSLRVSWASTDNPLLADQVDRLLAGRASADLVDDLDRLLRWRDDVVTYPGSGEPDEASTETLAVLLDRVDHPTLWLRLQFETPPTRMPPSLDGLRIHYPDTSLVNDLPAIYRDDPAAAGRLRQLIAPYEVLFEDLDRTLTSLPGRIDPATATDDWSAYLLGWLGFPPLDDLPAERRRALLEHGPTLLDRRGTGEGLQLVLDLVTGGRATVTDSGDRPAGWVLPPAAEWGEPAPPAALGLDTVVLAQRPAPARPGTLRLGATPLGHGCPDPTLVLAERASIVTLVFELSPEQRAELEPTIDRLLPIFVPAHCRLEVIYTGSDGGDRTRRLDVDFRLGPEGTGDGAGPEDAPIDGPHDAMLHSDAHWRLGSTSRVGRWTLPDPPYPPLVLDHRARLGAGPRLH